MKTVMFEGTEYLIPDMFPVGERKEGGPLTLMVAEDELNGTVYTIDNIEFDGTDQMTYDLHVDEEAKLDAAQFERLKEMVGQFLIGSLILALKKGQLENENVCK